MTEVLSNAFTTVLREEFGVLPTEMQLEVLIDAAFDGLEMMPVTDPMRRAFWESRGDPTSKWRALVAAAKGKNA